MTVIQDLRLKLELLERCVDGILLDLSESVNEHTLFDLLRRQDGLEWFQNRGSDLSLFQSHFMLMHVLYRLQQRYWQEQCGHLGISAMSIGILAYQKGNVGLQATDPLSSYYLDINNLQETTAEEVDEMLNGFWTRYLAGDGRADALAVLGLEADASRDIIEQQYRRLAAQHHPDRGGDDKQLAEFNKAIAILRKCVPN